MLAHQSKSRIQNPAIWLVDQNQIRGVNFKSIVTWQDWYFARILYIFKENYTLMYLHKHLHFCAFSLGRRADPLKKFQLTFFCRRFYYISTGYLQWKWGKTWENVFGNIFANSKPPLTPDCPKVKRPPPLIHITSNFLVFYGLSHDITLEKKCVAQNFIYRIVASTNTSRLVTCLG